MVFILNYKLFGLLSDVLFYFILGYMNKSLHIWVVQGGEST